MSKWKAIDTAPKDGTMFIGFDGTRPFLCFYSAGWCGDYHDGIDMDEQPTHWMPLPKAL